MWGEEEEDLREDLSGLPLERMIGEEEFLGIGDLPEIRYRGSVGDRGDSREEEDGKGTESRAGEREMERDGKLFC